MISRVRGYFLGAAFLGLLSIGGVRHAAQQPTPQNQTAQPKGPAQASPATPVPSLPVIVLDPGHGGTDTGARGGNGTLEKDVVLQFARAARAEFERLGFRVVMTRSDDSDPSIDERAAIANSYPNAIFITMHVASTGAPGTARAYYEQFPSSETLAMTTDSPASQAAGGNSASPGAPTRPGPIPWRHAQDAYTSASHRLADLVQSELDRQFSGSPNASRAAMVRGLRSVEAPAVAVETSTISTNDPTSLLAMAGPLAAALTRAVREFETAPAGANEK